MAASITHSLLDRLINDEPNPLVELGESEEAALERYKISLRHDLESLLNSKRPLLEGLEVYPDLGRSVIGYGIRDISTEDFSVPGARDRTRRMIAQAIREHETRLTDIDVEVDDAPTSRGIRLRISATLTLTRSNDTVVYEASVKPGDRTIAVSLSS